MKKNIISFLFLVGGLNYTLATPVDFSVNFSDHTGTAPAHPRTPVPSVDFNNGILTFQQDHTDYVLNILDEDGVVVYTIAVPTNLTIVTLPSWLSGEYEIRLYPIDSNVYFYGEISL